MSATEFVAWLAGGTGLFVSLTVLLIRKGQRIGLSPDLLVTIFLVGFIGVALVLVTKQGDSLAATNARQRVIVAQLEAATARTAEVEQRLVAAETCRREQVAAQTALYRALANAWSLDDDTTRRLAAQAVIDNPLPEC